MNTTPRVSITDFLLARIAEDEAVAGTASPSPWARTGGPDYVQNVKAADGSELAGGTWGYDAYLDTHNIDHLLTWQPARVLRECEAKRRIVSEYARLAPYGEYPEYHGARRALEGALRILAAVYADHPDYDPEWRLS